MASAEADSGVQWQVAAVGAVSGIVMAMIGLRPTGSFGVDLVVLAATSAFVTWGVSTAPWWALFTAVTTAINDVSAGAAVGDSFGGDRRIEFGVRNVWLN